MHCIHMYDKKVKNSAHLEHLRGNFLLGRGGVRNADRRRRRRAALNVELLLLAPEPVQALPLHALLPGVEVYELQ